VRSERTIITKSTVSLISLVVSHSYHSDIIEVDDGGIDDIRAYCGGLLKDSNGEFDRKDEATSFVRHSLSFLAFALTSDCRLKSS
jgi:hypothetical protein